MSQVKRSEINVVSLLVAMCCLVMVATTTLTTAGCNGNGSTDADTDTDTDTDSDSDSDTDTDTDSDTDSDSPFSSGIDNSSLWPEDGTTWTPEDGDTIEPEFETPEGDYDDGEYSVEVEGDNGTPSDTSDDWSKELGSGTAGAEETVTGNTLDLLTANTSSSTDGDPVKDGEELTFNYTIEKNGFFEETESTITIDGIFGEKPEVTGCYVNGSASVGAGLAICCFGTSPNGNASLDGNWGLTSDLDGTIIMSDGTAGEALIYRLGALGAEHVGLHTYTVTCNDGITTSDDYEFTVPVDEHDSGITVQCQDNGSAFFFLPETSIDEIASTCGTGYNPANKPSNNVEPYYLLDVTPSCVVGAIDALTAAEKEAHEHYNNGDTVQDYYSSCSTVVDFAQVEYTSHNPS